MLYKMGDVTPVPNQSAACDGMPFTFDIGMALKPRTYSIVMAVTTFQRLMACAVQFAMIVHKEGTACGGKFIEREVGFTAFKSGRKHAEGEFRRNL